MFEDLRRAFREAVDNFQKELNRDALPDTMDRLLRGMVQEVTDAKARLRGVEDDLTIARQKVATEEENVATMERRAKMALDIGDEETARLAAEYLTKHEARLHVFRDKAEALERETALLRSEVDEMMAKVKEARANRASISSQAGRTQARESLGESSDLFDAFDRMEAKIEGRDFEDEALREVDRELGGRHDDLRVDPEAPSKTEEIDYDAVLEELKRRMGRE